MDSLCISNITFRNLYYSCRSLDNIKVLLFNKFCFRAMQQIILHT